MAKDAGAIGKYFGSHLYYQERNDDGTALSTPDTWHDFGYVQELKVADTTDIEDAIDMSGSVVAQDSSKRTVKLTGLFMQSDKTTMDFLKSGCRSKYYAIYANLGVINGVTQELLAGICEIKPQVELASGVKRIPFEFSVLKNASAISSISTSGISGVKASTLSVSAEEYYSITETA